MQPVTYLPGDILKETLDKVRKLLGKSLEHLTIEKVVIGLFFTGVKLDNGAGGLCFTPVKAIPEAVCCPSSAKAMPVSGKLRGRKVLDALEDAVSSNPLKRTIGIALLNALSSVWWNENPPLAYEIDMGVDAFDTLEIPEESYVLVVGALVPVLKTLKAKGKPFGILELDTSTLKADELQYYVPPEMASARISQADVLVITGTTLINDSLEQILGLRKPKARVVVAGPTASMLPDAFFARGVEVLGGVTVTDADAVLDLIMEAGSGYHFFGKGAERMVIRLVDAERCDPEGKLGR